ncbi:MAG: cytochrome c oxidase assembly protein [Chloroflexi bacterium]|nr:cytochrome c oxidase assembly protein [Chloroflexota bacterium]
MYLPVPATLPERFVPHDTIGPEADWWTAWNFDPQYLIPIVLVGFIYARGLMRWNERSRRHPHWRTASYYSGLILLALLFESPLDRLGEHHFSMHMVQHNMVMMFVPPLIYLGAPTTPILKGLPRAFRKRFVAPALRASITRRGWSFLTYPPFAVALFAVSQWFWHLWPGVYDLALRDDVIHDLQHITFFAVSMIFWWNIVDPKPRRSRIHSMGFRIVYLYAAMVPKHILAAFITFADRVFYPTYEARELFLPLSPLDDQRLAGVLMWVPFGEILNLLIAACIFFVWWRQSDERTRAEEATRLAQEQAARGAPLPSGN